MIVVQGDESDDDGANDDDGDGEKVFAIDASTHIDIVFVEMPKSRVERSTTISTTTTTTTKSRQDVDSDNSNDDDSFVSLDDVCATFIDLVEQRIVHGARFAAMGVEPPRGVLLHGQVAAFGGECR